MSWKEIGIKDYLQTPITMLNISTGGRGIPLPSMFMVWGVKDSGKTTLSQTIPVWYLKKYPESKFIYVDTELKMDKVRLASFLLTNKINPNRVRIIQSSYIEDVFPTLLSEIREQSVLGNSVVIVIDSIADLIPKPKTNKKGEIKEESGGYSGAKTVVEISKQLQLLATEIKDTNSLVILVNQARQNLSTGRGYQYKGGEHLKHKVPIIIRMKPASKKVEKVGDVEIEKGVLSEFVVEKNQLFIPRLQGYIYIDNSTGINSVISNIETLLKYGIVKKAGAWKFVKVGDKEYKWRTEEEFMKLMNENDKFYVALNYALYKYFYDKYDSDIIKVKLIDVLNKYEELLEIPKTELPEEAKRLKEVIE